MNACDPRVRSEGRSPLPPRFLEGVRGGAGGEFQDNHSPMTTMPAPSNAPQSSATNAGHGTKSPVAYGADQIRILEGLEAVRKRPGMYIGDTGLAGLHHLVYEAVDNSIDECMAGRATMVAVQINADGSVSVTDDGSGIPIEKKKHPNPAYDGKTAVEIVMTVLHAGGKFGEEGSAYKVSGGLHGVGISVVNALSEWLECDVYRDGKIHRISFERGATKTQLHVIGEIADDARAKTGTRITFKPDHQIFPDLEFSYQTLSTRLREMAYLNPGVTIRVTDDRVGPDGNIKDETFRFDNGIVEYVEHLNHNKQTIHEVIFLRSPPLRGDVTCEVALQYNDSYNELLLSFANNIRTVDGGTHLSGLKTALTRTLNAYAKAAGILKEKDPAPSGEDLREGLAAVVSVKLPEPQFEGQTKGKLRNTEIEGVVSQVVGERLQAWLDGHPAEAKRICLKGALAAQAREAARRARDLTRRKSALESGSMPHKLRDCTTKDVDRSEMFIVEGDSAGGSATQGRDVETQAILPLRGKLLNVEKARLDKVLAFEEIRTLISALRCGIGEDFDIARLRYGRVIIMTDADVDGSHIRTLLLTFFFRQMPELIRRGKIFIAQPPLYLLTRGRKSQYVLNESKMNDTLIELGLDGASLLVRDIAHHPHTPHAQPPRVIRRIEGENLRRLTRLLRRLGELAEIVERRGLRFVDLIAARNSDPARQDRLPSHRIMWTAPSGESGDLFAWSDEQVREILKTNRLRMPDVVSAMSDGHASVPAEPGAVPSVASVGGMGGGGGEAIATVRELHENRELAILCAQIAELGLDINDYALAQQEAVTGEKLPTKYAWHTRHGASPGAKKTRPDPENSADEEKDEGDNSDESISRATSVAATAEEGGGRLLEAPNIPSILTSLLQVGRRGMEIKRFKGLGEMDALQLWETTMDHTKRTLMRVNWDDASVADELFTILMGEDVEQRRHYIEEHALEVKSLDI